MHAAPTTLRSRFRQWLRTIRRKVPPGLRLVLGLVLICGGLLGFLPILGFWMIPLGVAVAALDIAPLWRRLRHPGSKGKPTRADKG
ncbi:hypothetical protein [Rhodovulum adriaticum]|uniref:Uncharacterized protein n=1 Tax=Rhodovulum adriaticum TaxID=35804 RepID=A0A4V2SL17_RHOAD|nr:hypothetical protein [Rhodovulum adriaticum]MBK1634696.1 hypothetical protein [Rhodovulum adriaticum]TCP21596.1 hypothetical protein EV656_11064 [Rhodovulum adriaticum]